jgi:hypothetical protein
MAGEIKSYLSLILSTSGYDPRLCKMETSKDEKELIGCGITSQICIFATVI